MPQEMRHKSNRDAVARQLGKVILLLEQAGKEARSLQELLQAVEGAERTVAKKLVEPLKGEGRRRPLPAPIYAKLERALAVLQKLRSDIAATPVTRLEKDAATVKARAQAAAQETPAPRRKAG